MSFIYNSKDFHWTITWSSNNSSNQSLFDEELRSRWQQAMDSGHFRFDLSEVVTRIIPGKRNYIAQLNTKRGTQRRHPQAMSSVSQPFNDELFNFTKIKPQEILFEIKSQQSQDLSVKSQENGYNCKRVQNAQNLVIINVSPFEFGSILIVPDVGRCQPQIVTEDMLKLGLEMVLLSSHRGFRVGFNSLCALASVNHQHMHGYYCEHKFYIDTADVSMLGKGCYELVNTPVRGFVFQLFNSSIEEITKKMYTVLSYCLSKEIAHNVIFTRGLVIDGNPTPDDQLTIRAVIYPRKSVFGVPQSKIASDANCCEEQPFNAAMTELSGHLPIKTVAQYESLTEDQVDKILSEVTLDQAQFDSLKQAVLGIL